MSQTVGDYLLDRLATWGVNRIYGYPGDGINGLMGAFGRSSNGKRPEFIQARHEEMAAFMACAHAKFTGELGVCMATSGPGRDPPAQRPLRRQARPPAGGRDRRPAGPRGPGRQLPAGGRPGHAVQGRRARVRADGLRAGADPPPRRPRLPDRARRAHRDLRSSSPTTFRTPTPCRRRRASTAPSTPAPATRPRGSSRPTTELDRAAEILNAGERVAMLVGQGALHATDEVAESPTRSAPASPRRCSARRSLPDDLPYVTGSIGLLGTKPSWDMMQDCDTLLMVGSSFPYSEFLPEEGQARGVQIDIDGRMLGIRYPMEVNLVGDSAETLRALMPLLTRKEDRSWREKIEGEVAELVGADGAPRQRAGRPDQPAARVRRAVQAPARRRDPQLGLRLVGELVRARHQAAPRDDGHRCRARWPRWARACRTRSPPSSPIPTGP